MKFKFLLATALAGVLAPFAQAQNTANAVLNYNPGVGFATEFGTGAGYTNSSAALGLPTQTTPPPFASPVTPYNPAYGAQNLVSIGQGGTITLALSQPVENRTDHFGLDFIIFGNTGFVISNGDFTDAGITDGTLFGQNTGNTRISVSADNLNYFELTPSLRPVLDAYFPTDSAGNPTLPVNPSLTAADFNGKNLAGIRALYGGSAGGTGYDISSARTASGAEAGLTSIQYVKIDVLSGVAEIDAIVAVPEPQTYALGVSGLLVIGLAALRRRS
ncbi:MAG TPA: PEP-CTERM sorting domain-containing protein [Methylomirabilota bacterium]|nr:PEP-CTERM sorting domain-containing protein [Methylomirabilota bacterium]